MWVKPDGQPQVSGDRAGQGYECYVTTHRPGASRWNGGGKSSVLVFSKHDPERRGAPHPTVKPLRLMRRVVELYTDPGELVVDLYAGSGSTGIACLQLGRRFVGFERDPAHAAGAREALAAAAAGLQVGQHRAGQLPIF